MTREKNEDHPSNTAAMPTLFMRRGATAPGTPGAAVDGGLAAWRIVAFGPGARAISATLPEALLAKMAEGDRLSLSAPGHGGAGRSRAFIVPPVVHRPLAGARPSCGANETVQRMHVAGWRIAPAGALPAPFLALAPALERLAAQTDG